MKKTTLMLTALLLMAVTMVMAAPRTAEQMKQAARQAINQQRSSRHLAPRTDSVSVLRAVDQLQVIGYSDGEGFAVVTTDDLMPAVLGVSVRKSSFGHNPNFEWWLQATSEAVRHHVATQQPLHVTTPNPNEVPDDVPSMVTTQWYQMEPYSDMCPDFSDTEKCLTGCVATAMAQIIKYHRTPEHGQGERTIYYPHNNHTTGQPVTANFSEDYYDYEHMLDIYTAGNYTDEEAQAVALLMRDCGVAANMMYGGPDEGSGAYSHEAADGLRKYFGFEDAQCIYRDSYSEPDWMNMIYRELSENGPLYYAGADMFAGGHAFVFDGYNAQGMVSVNWGWAGRDDGYYVVSQLDPASYSFSVQQDMIVGITSPNHSLLVTQNVELTEAGQLQAAIEAMQAEEPQEIGTLSISGPLNAADMAYLRYLAGWDADGQPTGLRLRYLDLTQATLENNTLPDSIFKNCTTLRRVRLPESLTTIGREAFSGCRGLSDLRVMSKAVPELLGGGVFDGLAFGTANLYVTSGLKTKYLQAAQWSDFGENHIFQVGTSVKVRNAIRYYGEANPEFFYNVTGDDIEGRPTLTCDATQWSPAGRYTIHISAGSVQNAEAVNFIDGYLIVRKVEGARARVMNATRYEGEPNPEFKLAYTGLLSHDSEPTWTVEPQFSTTANENSPAGQYTVRVTKGEAESYEMTFTAGKLTVLPATDAITDLETSNLNSQRQAFNLQGQRIDAGGRRGLIIQNGKKVVR